MLLLSINHSERSVITVAAIGDRWVLRFFQETSQACMPIFILLKSTYSNSILIRPIKSQLQ